MRRPRRCSGRCSSSSSTGASSGTPATGSPLHRPDPGAYQGRRADPGQRASAIQGRSSAPHGRRRRRIPDQGQDHQQVSRQRLPGAVELRPCARPAREGRLGAAGRGLPDHLRAARAEEAAHRRDRARGPGRSPPLPRDRPRPRGRGDLLAPRGGAERARRDQRRRRQAGGVPRDHQARGARGDAAPARARRGPDRRLPGAPRARLPGGLHPLAGAMAQAPGLALGGPRAVGGAAPDLRARGRDRGLPPAGVLDDRGPVHDACGGALRRPPRAPRRQAAAEVRPRERGRRQARASI